MKVTKRDIKFFIAGILAWILISFVWDWEQNIQDFKDGYNEGYNDARSVESDE